MVLNFHIVLGVKLSQDMAIRPVFEYMMNTLGLVIKIPSDEEIERIYYSEAEKIRRI